MIEDKPDIETTIECLINDSETVIIWQGFEYVRLTEATLPDNAHAST